MAENRFSSNCECGKDYIGIYLICALTGVSEETNCSCRFFCLGKYRSLHFSPSLLNSSLVMGSSGTSKFCARVSLNPWMVQRKDSLGPGCCVTTSLSFDRKVWEKFEKSRATRHIKKVSDLLNKGIVCQVTGTLSQRVSARSINTLIADYENTEIFLQIYAKCLIFLS